MAVTYTIDPDRRLVLMRTEGQAPLDEWFTRFDEAVANPEFGPGFAFICDRTGAAEVPNAAAARTWAQQFGNRVRSLGGGARLAIVVAEPAVYGMVRMAAILAEMEGATVGVFYSEAEALEWLALAVDRSSAATET
jgi:hypothetical protein